MEYNYQPCVFVQNLEGYERLGKSCIDTRISHSWRFHWPMSMKSKATLITRERRMERLKDKFAKAEEELWSLRRSEKIFFSMT